MDYNIKEVKNLAGIYFRGEGHCVDDLIMLAKKTHLSRQKEKRERATRVFLISVSENEFWWH